LGIGLGFRVRFGGSGFRVNPGRGRRVGCHGDSGEPGERVEGEGGRGVGLGGPSGWGLRLRVRVRG